jgi:RNA polymerase-binding transcription factor DksA
MTRRLDVEKFRQLLLEERARLEAQVKRMAKRASSEDQSDEFSELADYDNHPADAASETFEREKEMAIDENTESLINSIDRALEKMDASTYGVCDRCSNEISKARLEALP